jgi:hypothetical protein
VFMSAARWRSAAQASRRKRRPGPNTTGVARANCSQRPNGPSVPGMAPCDMATTSSGTLSAAATMKSRRMVRCSCGLGLRLRLGAGAASTRGGPGADAVRGTS